MAVVAGDARVGGERGLLDAHTPGGRGGRRKRECLFSLSVFSLLSFPLFPSSHPLGGIKMTI